MALFPVLQDGGRRHLGKISNRHICANGRPSHFMFGYRVGFLRTADLMALFSIRTAAILHNFEWPYLRNGSRSTYIAVFAIAQLLCYQNAELTD